MLPNKRLQIFVSSTYKDLIEERQAAVQAILSAGHIPAGMELFAAGDQSQMKVIKDWIDQSDIYMLILGGAYGSIDPNSGKSYTHIEYEYALSINKPLFSVVISDEHLEEKVRQEGSKVIEKENHSKYLDFKKMVLSKMVRFWGDAKDIKLSIYETVSDFARRTDLVGWVPGDQKVDTSKMAEELARLGEENSRLQKENRSLKLAPAKLAFKDLSSKRRGFTQQSKIVGQIITVSTSEYKDGTLGALMIDLEKEGSSMRSIYHYFAQAVSLGLQYGVPLVDFVDLFVFTKFEPAGMVDHPNIRTTTSILDFIFRLLAYEYLGRTDLVHILDKPETNAIEDVEDENS